MSQIKLYNLLENKELYLEKKKGIRDEDEIIVPQIGKMLFKSLKKNVEEKSKDLYNRIRRGEYDKISDSMLELFSHMVRVSRAYQTGNKVPSTTLFKESIDE